MGLSQQDIERFIEGWFDKQPDETLTEAMERRMRLRAEQSPKVRWAIEFLEERMKGDAQ